MQQSPGQAMFDKLIDARHKREDQSAEIMRLHEKLAQIVVVIDDNAATGDKKMTLDFVRQIATSK